VIVSHDRHMIELTADRLVLVDEGTAQEFAGTLDDYTDLILKGAGKTAGPKVDKKEARKLAAAARDQEAALRKAAVSAETEMAKLTDRRSAIERAMFDPTSATGPDAKLTMSELMKLRADISAQIEAAESKWLEASEALG
jgi:ATP-binding cassette, subfamily F, member 3